MSRIDLDIARYSAWAPGLETAAEWQRWARAELPIGTGSAAKGGGPAVEFLPSLFRRRLSRLSRMALQVAHDCTAGERDIPTVFCSRHGELTRTVELLLDQNKGEALSPTAFSMSVHNTASGLHSIASGNTAPSNALAAMADSLPAALIDAAAMIVNGRASRVLVVVAEEPVAAIYQDFVAPEFAFAAAFLLVKRTQVAKATVTADTTRLTLAFSAHPSERRDTEQQGLALLRFLYGQSSREPYGQHPAQPLVLNGERLQWAFFVP